MIENEISTETISFEVSDHIPTIALTKSLRPRIIKNVPYWSRDERNLNVDNFLDELGNNLSLQTSQDSAEDNWNAFEQTLAATLNKHAPLTQMSRKKNRLRQKPWITRPLLQTIKYEQVLYKNA